MRRLPVYLLLDTSGSMQGEPLAAVKNGVEVLISTLRQDPYALETASVSIITFGEGGANQVVRLTDLSAFQMPDLGEADGFTPLGEAMSLLADCIGREVVTSTNEVKGDWKPIVFLLTDGAPSDDWKTGLRKLRTRKVGNIVACMAKTEHSDGREEIAILKQITEGVVMLDSTDSNAIKSYFKWISSSISVSSSKIDSNVELNGLAQLPPPPQNLQVI